LVKITTESPLFSVLGRQWLVHQQEDRAREKWLALSPTERERRRKYGEITDSEHVKRETAIVDAAYKESFEAGDRKRLWAARRREKRAAWRALRSESEKMLAARNAWKARIDAENAPQEDPQAAEAARIRQISSKWPRAPYTVICGTIEGRLAPRSHALWIWILARYWGPGGGVMADGRRFISLYAYNSSVEFGCGPRWLHGAARKLAEQAPSLVLHYTGADGEPATTALISDVAMASGRLYFKLPPAVVKLVEDSLKVEYVHGEMPLIPSSRAKLLANMPRKTPGGAWRVVTGDGYGRFSPSILAGMESSASQRFYLLCCVREEMMRKHWSATMPEMRALLGMVPNEVATHVEEVIERAISDMPYSSTMVVDWSPWIGHIERKRRAGAERLPIGGKEIREYVFLVMKPSHDLRSMQKSRAHVEYDTDFLNIAKRQWVAYQRNLRRKRDPAKWFATWLSKSQPVFRDGTGEVYDLRRLAENIDAPGAREAVERIRHEFEVWAKTTPGMHRKRDMPDFERPAEKNAPLLSFPAWLERSVHGTKQTYDDLELIFGVTKSTRRAAIGTKTPLGLALAKYAALLREWRAPPPVQRLVPMTATEAFADYRSSAPDSYTARLHLKRRRLWRD
jgi:hypothetical protein